MRRDTYSRNKEICVSSKKKCGGYGVAVALQLIGPMVQIFPSLLIRSEIVPLALVGVAKIPLIVAISP